MKSIITISVSEAGTPLARTFAFRILVDGRVLSERALTPVESQEVRELAGQYTSLFEKGCQVDAKDYLAILSAGLFHLFLEKAWQELEGMIAPGVELVVASTIPEVLQLPWELLPFLSGDGRHSIRRIPGGIPAGFSGVLPPGPLRVLFLACEPLDYEEEERWMLQAAEGLDMVLEIADKGSFEELGSRAGAFRPHLVHLTGRAKLKAGQAAFSLQGPGGRPDLRSPQELAPALAGAQCVLLGGCQIDSPSALDLLCQGMVARLPLAVGWNASTESVREFYSALAAGKSIDEALGTARLDLQKRCREQGMVCALPVLYAASDQPMLFDPEKRAEVMGRKEEMPPLKGLSEGYAECFVDRRADLQRLTSALEGGMVRTLIITGPDGAGKSTLATKLGLDLASSGYTLMPVYSSPANPISAARILDAFISLTASSQPEIAQALRNPAAPVAERLKKALQVLDNGKLLMVWDGLELDAESGRIRDPDLADFYLRLLKELDRSRVIITSAALPGDAMTLPSRAWEWRLQGLPEAAFIDFLLRDETVAELYRRGEVGYEKLREQHESVAGMPACLAQMRKALEAGRESGLCDEILDRLCAALSPVSRLALSRAAVYGVAVSLSALAAVTGLPEEEAAACAREWQKLSLAYRAGELWAVPSSARPHLQAALDKEQLFSANEDAGDLLRGLAEGGRAAELGISRYDCLAEARGHYLAAGDLDSGRYVTARISGYLVKRGFYDEVVRLNQELLEKELHPAPMNWIARALQGQGRHAEAEKWYTQAVAAGPNHVAWHGLGTARFALGLLDSARDSFQKAVDICREQGDEECEAMALHSLASVDIEQKDDPAAIQKLQRAADIQGRLGDLRGRASTLQDMGHLDLRLGDRESARSRLSESLQLLERVGDLQGEAQALFNLASIDMEKGDLEKAKEEFGKSLLLKRVAGDRHGEAAILHSLGLIDAQAGDMELAGDSFRETLRIYQELGDKPGEAGAFFQLGALAVQQDRIQQGLKLMAMAAIILRSASSPEVKEVEPLVERLASQLSYSQEQFLEMVRTVTAAYRRDRGWSLIEESER